MNGISSIGMLNYAAFNFIHEVKCFHFFSSYERLLSFPNVHLFSSEGETMGEGEGSVVQLKLKQASSHVF